MKRVLGVMVLILGFSIPAHAQASRGTVPASGGSGGMTTGGGGGFGGSGSGDSGGMSGVNFHTLPSIPPANLPSVEVSGTKADFVPSTFLPFDQAVAEGQAVLDAQHKSVAQAAAENSRANRAKAKAAIIENGAGDAVIARP